MQVVIPEVVADRIKIDDAGCWNWQLHLDRDGYGRKYLNAKQRAVIVHRWVYEMLVKPIPSGLQIDHLCRNRACCNPEHLEPVTPRENLSRSNRALTTINSKKVHCPKGHPYSGDNLHVGPNGSRVCKICRRETLRAWRRKNA